MSLNFATTGGTEKKKKNLGSRKRPNARRFKVVFSVILAMDVAGEGAVTSVY
jgi:hypothetical protein